MPELAHLVLTEHSDARHGCCVLVCDAFVAWFEHAHLWQHAPVVY